MKDSYRHKGLRAQLVEVIRQKGIDDPRILDAIGKIPRHLFLDKAFEEWAYKDVAFPIGHEQTISQPYTVAYQTQLLELRGKMKVLEIGTGSGYQACVLVEMGAKVYSVERQQSLFIRTSEFLPEIGYGMIRTLFGDGYQGCEKFAPFDRILVTASSPNIPQTLVDQLKEGGKLIVPVGNDEIQTMKRITKLQDGKLEEESFGNFSFVPFLKGVVKAS